MRGGVQQGKIVDEIDPDAHTRLDFDPLDPEPTGRAAGMAYSAESDDYPPSPESAPDEVVENRSGTSVVIAAVVLAVVAIICATVVVVLTMTRSKQASVAAPMTAVATTPSPIPTTAMTTGTPPPPPVTTTVTSAPTTTVRVMPSAPPASTATNREVCLAVMALGVVPGDGYALGMTERYPDMTYAQAKALVARAYSSVHYHDNPMCDGIAIPENY